MITALLRTRLRLSLLSSSRAPRALTPRLVPLSSLSFHIPPRARALSTSPPLHQSYDDPLDVEAETDRTVPFRKAIPQNKTLFVGNLPYTTEEEDLRELFSPIADISTIRMAIAPDGRMRGFAHIDFASLPAAADVLAHHASAPITLLQRTLRIDYAPPRKEAQVVPYRKLYFFDFQYGEEELREAFVRSGVGEDVVGVYMMRNPETGTSLGAGFIEFASIEHATNALNKTNGIELDADSPGVGTTLKLAYARPPKARDHSSSSGSGYGSASSSRGYGLGGRREGGRTPEYGGGGRARSGDWGAGRKSSWRGRGERDGGRGGGGGFGLRSGGGREERGGGGEF